MPNLVPTLEQVEIDDRSGELAYRLKIASIEPTAVQLFQVSPQVPDDVSLVDVKDASREADQARRAALLDELSALLTEHLSLSVEEFRRTQVEIDKQAFKEILQVVSSINLVFRAYLELFRGTLLKAQRRARERQKALEYRIAR